MSLKEKKSLLIGLLLFILFTSVIHFSNWEIIKKNMLFRIPSCAWIPSGLKQKNSSLSIIPNLNTSCAELATKDWLVKMKDKYRKINERIQEVCQKLKNITEKANALPVIQPHNFWVDEKHNLTYCMQPKVGSTTWKELFYSLMPSNEKKRLRRKQGSLLTHRDIGAYFMDNLITYLNKSEIYTKHKHANLINAVNTFKFSFVRHPFERLVSAYINKHKKFLRQIKKFKGNISQSLSETIQCFKKTPSFRTFVDYVISEHDNYWDKAWPNIPLNQHWISLERKCWYCDVTYDVIGRMETFSDDVKYIICKNNLENTLPLHKSLVKKNSHKYHHSTKLINSQYLSLLNKNQLQKLFNIYRLDFALFEYDLHDYN